MFKSLRLLKSEQPWCRSQARINGEGCDRKSIRRKTYQIFFNARCKNLTLYRIRRGPGKRRPLPVIGHQGSLGCKEEVESSGEEGRREMKRGRKLRRSN